MLDLYFEGLGFMKKLSLRVRKFNKKICQEQAYGAKKHLT
jgi:hypothetical protein